MRHPVDPKSREANVTGEIVGRRSPSTIPPVDEAEPVELEHTLPDLRAPEVDEEGPDGFDYEDKTIRETGALGELANGRYLLARQLGRGGMGTVYEARDTQMDRMVAVKLLHSDPIDPQVLGRFVIEARVAASIPHENICGLLDVGIDTRTNAPYMAMELLTGKDLDAILRARGPLPIDEACGYIVQACSGLAAAHRMGVVHRDVKLSNLFVVEGERRLLKVLDFGVSKAPSFGDVTRLTSTGTMIGSPCYMAPEQVRNARAVDQRADVWSIGVVLYELLTGVPPFMGQSVMELFEQILRGEAKPIRELRPDVPEGLAQIVNFTLQKERDRRYGNLELLEQGLTPYAHRAPPSSLKRTQKIQNRF